jgi:hypothetical protein
VAEERRHDGWWRVCDRCGDRLGIYEPLLVRYPDGRIDRSSYLNLPEHVRAELSACFHAQCVPADGEPGWS